MSWGGFEKREKVPNLYAKGRKGKGGNEPCVGDEDEDVMVDLT